MCGISLSMIVHLQIFIGSVAALFCIVMAVAMAGLLIGGSFSRDWPPDWFANVAGAAAIVACGFGVAEAFLALTRVAIGS